MKFYQTTTVLNIYEYDTLESIISGEGDFKFNRHNWRYYFR